MLEFLFSNGGYTPHGFCLAWNPWVLWLHIWADLLIAISYFSLPILILQFLRRRGTRDMYLPAMLFAAFILLCGITHLISIVTLWVPIYGIQGVLKMATGVVSAVTALSCWRIMPTALQMPTITALNAANHRHRSERVHRRQAEKMARVSREMLARKVEELNATNRELGQFAYAASHDLQSPSRSLAMSLDMLDEDHGASLDDEGRVLLQQARMTADRMTRMTKDILDFAELLDGKSLFERLDLNVTFTRAAEALSDQIAKTGAEVDIGKLPRAIADAHQLDIVARNLLENALTYCDPDEPPRIVVSCGPADTPNEVEIRISDNGIGIAPEHLDRIFVMFTRLDHSSQVSGSGMGLAICQRAMAMQGGSIRVTSAPGKGSTFILRLPAPPVSERPKSLRGTRRVR